MEFLKEILGDELYSQVSEKINSFNGDEANKDKQIKIGNLSTGEYVGKGKYDALDEMLKGKDTELTTANKLIADLKKSTKGNEDLQGKINDYETQVTQLQSELQETKLKSAIKVALLSEKAVDVDYLTYKLNEKLKEKGEALELDENDNIKNWDSRVTDLRTQFPSMFESATGTDKKIIDNKLPDNDENKAVTKSDILKMPYAQRLEYKNNNLEAYSEIMKK